MKCASCEYDLSGLADGVKCPECGAAHASSQRVLRMRDQVAGRILMITACTIALASVFPAISFFQPGAIATGSRGSLERLLAAARFESLHLFLAAMLALHFVIGMICIGLHLEVRRCRAFRWVLWMPIGIGFVLNVRLQSRKY